MNKYLLLFLLLTLSADVKAQLTFGYFSEETVIEEVPELVQIQNRLQQYEDLLLSELDSLNTAFEATKLEGEDLVNAGADEETISTLESQLRNLENKLMIKVPEANKNYQQRREQLLVPYLNKINRIMEEVTLENGVDVVLDRKYTPNNFVKELESESVIDLTPLIIERILEN